MAERQNNIPNIGAGAAPDPNRTPTAHRNASGRISGQNGEPGPSGSDLTELPDGLTVPDDLELAWTDISDLPENLTVGNDLNLRYTNIKRIPTGLSVGNDLDLEGSTVESLPDNLTVPGELNLKDTPIKELPKGLSVGFGLNLEKTAIAALPPDLKVHGDLNLSDTPIESLPDGLTVHGSLYLSRTPVTELPKGLTVTGTLGLGDTAVTGLPEDLTVGGSLYARCEALESLPDGLTVGKDLDLRLSGIKALPARLAVGGDLDLRCTGIRTLPNDLAVGGRVLGDLPDDEIKKVHLLWEGDYAPSKYVYADGQLVHVSRRMRIGNLTFYDGKFDSVNAISDGTGSATCENFREGVDTLRRKAAARYSTSWFDDISMDDDMTSGDIVRIYAIITDADSREVETFRNRLPGYDDEFPIRKAVELAKGLPGEETFRSYFAIPPMPED